MNKARLQRIDRDKLRSIMTSHEDLGSNPIPDHEFSLVGLELTDNAKRIGQGLLAERELNLGAAGMYMRAFAGLYNGQLNEDNHELLSDDAKRAEAQITAACYGYLKAVGQLEAVDKDMEIYKDGEYDVPSDYYLARTLLNIIQQGVEVAARDESARQMTAIRNGFKPQEAYDGLNLKEEPFDVAERQRKTSNKPYSVEGIRQVLKTMVDNMPAIFLSAETFVSPGVPRAEVMKHAIGCIAASQPTPR